MEEKKYWPFPVLPPEKQTELHKKQMRFLETALGMGYRPYVFGSDNFGALGPTGRLGEIIHRGANRRWEVWLTTPGSIAGTKMVEDFDIAAQAILGWLRGADVEKCLS